MKLATLLMALVLICSASLAKAQEQICTPEGCTITWLPAEAQTKRPLLENPPQVLSSILQSPPVVFVAQRRPVTFVAKAIRARPIRSYITSPERRRPLQRLFQSFGKMFQASRSCR